MHMNRAVGAELPAGFIEFLLPLHQKFTPWQQSLIERRQQILTVAAAAFAERGFGSVTMEEIAGRVGVTRLILYRAFASKEDLYRAILTDTASRLTAAMTDRNLSPWLRQKSATRAGISSAGIRSSPSARVCETRISRRSR